MCLYVKDYNPKVAKKDIVCYKLLRENIEYPSETKRYYTPFQDLKIILGQEVKAKGGLQKGTRKIFEWSSNREYRKLIYSGVIHTFKTFKDVEDFMLKFASQYDAKNAVVVRCVIPKGTEYYEGIFESTGLKSYASKKLIYGGRILKRYYDLKENKRWYKYLFNL